MKIIKTLTAKNDRDWTINLDGKIICDNTTKDSIVRVGITDTGNAYVSSFYKVKNIDETAKIVYITTNENNTKRIEHERII